MTTAPATGYVPTAVPEDYIVRLTDHGRWRERGITHWHLVKSDLPFVVNGRPNEDRFNPERIAAAVARAERITTDPRQALRWIYETQIAALLAGSDPAAYANQRGWHSEDVLCQHIEVTWETLTLRCGQLTPAGFGMETRQNHASDVFAYPQTAETCRRH